MKRPYTAALTLVLLASCGPDMAAIDHANHRAEAAASRSESSAANAEKASNQALAASEKVEREAAGAEDATRRANDLYTRVCSVPLPVYGCSADHKRCWPTPEYERFLKIQLEACERK